MKNEEVLWVKEIFSKKKGLINEDKLNQMLRLINKNEVITKVLGYCDEYISEYQARDSTKVCYSKTETRV